MTITHPDTEIVLDDRVPIVRLRREFDAPVASLFRCHAEPELFARWIGPHRLTTTIGDWEFRTGGRWSFEQHEDGNTFGFYGSFHEIRPDELIVQTFAFAGFPDGVSLERLTFTDLGGGRSRLDAASLVDSFEGRDAMISSGMESGIRDGYEKLDDLLSLER